MDISESTRAGGPAGTSASTASMQVQRSFDTSAAGDQLRFSFTGSGQEYFRIWIVNLCLTVMTMGIYSPWAKVRRLQYFSQNTRLGDAVFDFHGSPTSILIGRVITALFFIAYHYAFGFSKAIGLVVITFLLLALPWLIRSALCFRLRNTSYRAIRFGFRGSLAGAYAAYSPVILLFLLPTIIVAMDPAKAKWVPVVFLLYLAWPWLYARIRAYQHRHFQYGAACSSYHSPTGDFFATYFFAGLMGLCALVPAAIVLGVGAAFISAKNGGAAWAIFLPVLGVVVVGYFGYLVAGPYLQARIFNLVWSNTTFPDARLQSDLSASRFIRLQITNALLTLLTFGLYRPFAVVRTYQYRVASISIEGRVFLNKMQCGARTPVVGASGDSTAELFAFELSW